MTALNISSSEVCRRQGLSQSKSLSESYYYADFTFEEDRAKFGPLAHWNTRVMSLTHLDREGDLTEPYKAMIKFLDSEVFEGALKNDKKVSFKD